jgi:LEA14-like dessication related protein
MTDAGPARLLAALLAGLALLSGCATLGPEPPRVSIAGLQPVQMDVLEQEYELRLRIQNRSEHPLEIRGMAYDVYLNGKRFASGVNATAIDVPPFEERVVPVRVVTGVFAWLRQLGALGRDAPARLTYRIEGTMKLAGRPGRLAFEQAGELELPGPATAP